MTSVYGQYSLLICCHHLPTTCSLKNIVERLSCHQLVASVERLPLMPVCSQLTEGSTQQRQSCWMWSLTCYEQLIEDRSVYYVMYAGSFGCFWHCRSWHTDRSFAEIARCQEIGPDQDWTLSTRPSKVSQRLMGACSRPESSLACGVPQK